MSGDGAGGGGKGGAGSPLSSGAGGGEAGGSAAGRRGRGDLTEPPTGSGPAAPGPPRSGSRGQGLLPGRRKALELALRLAGVALTSARAWLGDATGTGAAGAAAGGGGGGASSSSGAGSAAASARAAAASATALNGEPVLRCGLQVHQAAPLAVAALRLSGWLSPRDQWPPAAAPDAAAGSHGRGAGVPESGRSAAAAAASAAAAAAGSAAAAAAAAAAGSAAAAAATAAAAAAAPAPAPSAAAVAAELAHWRHVAAACSAVMDLLDLRWERRDAAAAAAAAGPSASAVRRRAAGGAGAGKGRGGDGGGGGAGDDEDGGYTGDMRVLADMVTVLSVPVEAPHGQDGVTVPALVVRGGRIQPDPGACVCGSGVAWCLLGRYIHGLCWGGGRGCMCELARACNMPRCWGRVPHSECGRDTCS